MVRSTDRINIGLISLRHTARTMNNIPLSDEERALLSARADEFYAALVRDTAGDWGAFLNGIPQSLRPAILTELIIIDMAHRWKQGEQPKVEDYLRRFPELGTIDQVHPAVILEEHRCRMKAGERPDPEGFKARFPAQYPQIREELETGRAGTFAGTLSATLASADGGAAVAHALSPGGADHDYEFLKVLGRGVFGEVWLARKCTSGIEKAIKILLQAGDHDSEDRERRSLELIKNLRHPYLLATEDFWIAESRLHIVMELAECTLRDELRRSREAGQSGIAPNQLLGYMWEAAEGLDFLHSRHVIHRDVKPDNILLLHGHAKVADFGLARYQEEILAPTRTFAGTPAYMAPEVWGRSSGPASDQYSLAMAYAELRQGSPPLRPRPLQEMLVAHAQGLFEFAEIIQPGEREIILKALASEPEHRFESCRAFVEALTQELKHNPVPRSGDPFTPASVGGASLASETASANDRLLTPPSKNSTTEPATQSFPPPVSKTLWNRGHQTTLIVGLLTIGVMSAAAFGMWKLIGENGTLSNGSQSTRHELNPQPITENPKLWLPPKTIAAKGAKPVQLADGKKTLYDWIEMNVAGEPVRFRLITGSGTGPPVTPFYMMDSKVWVRLYRAGGATPPKESELNGENAPLTHVTASEAAAFATKAFNGRLPSPLEWDHAAGLYSRLDRDDVTRPNGKPHHSAKQPRAAHGPEAGSDFNEFDLRDMAGNGWEWTNQVLNSAEIPQKVVGQYALNGDDLVVTRGRNFTFTGGLTFPMLRDQQTTPHTQFATARSPYTSFRVVLPLE